jgi:uncharacterized integral membrane protein
MRFLFLIALLVAAFAAMTFTALNPVPVEVQFGIGRTGTTLGFALIIAFVSGLLAGVIWRVRWVAELLAERGRLRRALRLAESKARADAVAGDRQRA